MFEYISALIRSLLGVEPEPDWRVMTVPFPYELERESQPASQVLPDSSPKQLINSQHGASTHADYRLESPRVRVTSLRISGIPAQTERARDLLEHAVGVNTAKQMLEKPGGPRYTIEFYQESSSQCQDHQMYVSIPGQFLLLSLPSHVNLRMPNGDHLSDDPVIGEVVRRNFVEGGPVGKIGVHCPDLAVQGALLLQSPHVPSGDAPLCQGEVVGGSTFMGSAKWRFADTQPGGERGMRLEVPGKNLIDWLSSYVDAESLKESVITLDLILDYQWPEECDRSSGKDTSSTTASSLRGGGGGGGIPPPSSGKGNALAGEKRGRRNDGLRGTSSDEDALPMKRRRTNL